MSQKNAKRLRRLEERVDAMEHFNATWDAAEASVHNQDVLDAAAERSTERRRARQAERTAALWRRVAYIALVAAIIVEIIAILVIHANAACTDDTKNTPIFATKAPEEMVQCEIQEDFENESIEAALLARAHAIEDVTVTHYDCCVECCGKDDGITASGVRATPGVTVAVDPTVIPLGSDVLVDYGDGEIHFYRADDTGGAVKGNHIDLCVSTHEEAMQLGCQTATVYWVAPERVN